jgi:hypothetical protein
MGEHRSLFSIPLMNNPTESKIGTFSFFSNKFFDMQLLLKLHTVDRDLNANSMLFIGLLAHDVIFSNNYVYHLLFRQFMFLVNNVIKPHLKSLNSIIYFF